MNVSELERINEIIHKAETQKAKSEGVIEKIKESWKQKYGTDDENEIRRILSHLEDERNQTVERMESVYAKILNSNDWDKLESEL